MNDDEAYAYTLGGRVAWLPFERLKWARRYIDDTHRGPEPKNAREVLKEGDIILVQSGDEGCSWLAEIPEVAGALVSLNPDDGAVRALVGGFDFYQSKFNRAVQAKRQPGSSFKPFIYTAALDKGFTAASVINDAPVVFEAPGLEDTWRPENYTGRFYGPTRLREALVKSRNLVSIRLLRDIGIGYARRYATRFGFTPQDLPRDLSLALGSGSLTPLELAAGYTVFANGGYRVAPFFISHVLGPDGSVFMRTVPSRVCPDCQPAQISGLESELANDTGSAAGAPASTTTERVAQPPAGDSAPITGEAPTPALAQTQPQDPLAATAPLFQPGSLVPVAGGADARTHIAPTTAEAAPQGTEVVALELQPEEQEVVPVPPMFISAERVLEPQTSFLINTMLRDVIRRGTGVRARKLGRNDLSGKTGTTNDQQDAWFSGFSRGVVTTAWVGFDNPRPLGDRETGARAALPMWIEFMSAALAGEPEVPLAQPPGMVSVRIDAETGRLADVDSDKTLFEYFHADQVPQSRQVQGPVRLPDPGSGNGDITEQLF